MHGIIEVETSWYKHNSKISVKPMVGSQNVDNNTVIIMADVICTYVSANKHDVIRTYGHFGYTRQMATLYVTDNKSN